MLKNKEEVLEVGVGRTHLEYILLFMISPLFAVAADDSKSISTKTTKTKGPPKKERVLEPGVSSY